MATKTKARRSVRGWSIRIREGTAKGNGTRGTHFCDNKKCYPKGLREEVEAQRAMPGMMDTDPEPRLNDKTVEGLAQVSKNRRFAWDWYRRFVAMYGDVFLELKPLDRD